MAKKQWKFNARYTLCLTGLVLALGVLLYFWHAAAVRRNATAMLSRADYFRAQGDRKSEAKCLRSFLSLNPLDDAALTRFAEAMDAFGDTFTDKANAARALALALAQPGNAQRKDLQQRHIRLLWELNRLREAIDHCDAILTGTDGQKQETTDPLCREAMVVTALASFDLAAQSSQRGNWYGIVRLLNDAIAVEPSVNDQRELTNRLAAVYGDPSVTVALPAAD